MSHNGSKQENVNVRTTYIATTIIHPHPHDKPEIGKQFRRIILELSLTKGNHHV